MKKPNLFIVGAPKCGTTAMHDYLGQHPQVFMSATKEPCYFGSDLTIVNRKGHVRELEPYLELFQEAGEEKWRGESTIWYLVSQRAAAEIREFNPWARIIAMLRNPVDYLYSLHTEYLWNSNEDLEDLEAALDAEPDRRAGRRLPPQVQILQGIWYREMAAFSSQVRRYFDAFGRDRVRVIIFDDLKKDVNAVYRETLRFLEIDDAFEADLRIVNPQKLARNRTLQTLLNAPPEGLIRTARSLVPPMLRGRIFSRLKEMNNSGRTREPLSDRVRRRLQRELLPEVERLSALLDRDLTHWCRIEEPRETAGAASAASGA